MSNKEKLNQAVRLLTDIHAVVTAHKGDALQDHLLLLEAVTKTKELVAECNGETFSTDSLLRRISKLEAENVQLTLEIKSANRFIVTLQNRNTMLGNHTEALGEHTEKPNFGKMLELAERSAIALEAMAEAMAEFVDKG